MTPAWGGLKIDANKLPGVAAVDAGVLMRALDPRMNDTYASACRAFWAAMLATPGRRIIIPAPSLAEHLTGKGAPPPNTEQVHMVPFDSVAAEILAKRLPEEVRKLEAELAGVSKAVIKYDAMIVATAKRWQADRLVSLDERVQKRLGPKAQISCVLPTFFYGEQLALT